MGFNIEMIGLDTLHTVGELTITGMIQHALYTRIPTGTNGHTGLRRSWVVTTGEAKTRISVVSVMPFRNRMSGGSEMSLGYQRQHLSEEV